MMKDWLNQKKSIPVLYYHSVADHRTPHPWGILSLGRDIFIAQIEAMQRAGYRTVFLDDVFSYMTYARRTCDREVVLTFDDGFLDNWVFVWPLAKKYGFKFTVFVNPEFVDPRPIVRPTLESVWRGECQESDLSWWGYLSWDEMREMERSGLVDIQSHALTHTWYPIQRDIVDFHHPGDRYFWLVWNAHPEQKPFWLTHHDERTVPFGVPVYDHAKSIVSKRYFPDPRVDEALAGYVERHGGDAFFTNTEWRDELHREVRRVYAERVLDDRYETDEAYEARLRDEIGGSKRRIEAALDKEVRYLCWPGGGEHTFAHQIALEEGYWATTKGSDLNRPGHDPTRIYRVSSWFELTSNVPAQVKWLLFGGQLDRSRGDLSARGVLTSTLSWINRARVSRASRAR